LNCSAGAAAALAASEGCAPRAVPIAGLQALLRRQGAFLRSADEQAVGSPAVSVD
jgi:hypothetical protein